MTPRDIRLTDIDDIEFTVTRSPGCDYITVYGSDGDVCHVYGRDPLVLTTRKCPDPSAHASQGLAAARRRRALRRRLRFGRFLIHRVVRGHWPMWRVHGPHAGRCDGCTRNVLVTIRESDGDIQTDQFMHPRYTPPPPDLSLMDETGVPAPYTTPKSSPFIMREAPRWPWQRG